LCKELIGDPYVATSGVAFPQDHRLWKYCDAPMHLDCLEQWPDREEFSLGYYESEYEHHQALGRNILGEGENWLLVCGPHRRSDLSSFRFVGKITPADMPLVPSYAKVVLRHWPFQLYSKWNDWTEYANTVYAECLTGKALEAAHAVMNEVREIAPNKERLAKRLEVICRGE